MIVFSLCHATARIPGWEKAAIQWFVKANHPERVEYILATDEPLTTPVPIGFFDGHFKTTTMRSSPRGAVAPQNRAAAISQGKVIVIIADDFFPCPGWDTELLKAIPDLDAPSVLDVDNQDGAYPLIAHPIMTRAYYERFGYVIHPDYPHTMGDVEFTEVARQSGCVIDARHLTFLHLNPDTGTAQWDDVYHRNRSKEMLDQGRAIFKRREAARFPKESVLEVQCS